MRVCLISMLLLSTRCIGNSIKSRLNLPLSSLAPEKRITNGEPSQELYRSKTALIFLRDIHGRDYLWCTGSILNKNNILTSATCVTFDGVSFLANSKYKMGIIPNTKATIDQEISGQIFVKSFYVHKKYNFERRQADIAILKLEKDIPEGTYSVVKLKRQQKGRKGKRKMLVSVGYGRQYDSVNQKWVRTRQLMQAKFGNYDWCEPNQFSRICAFECITATCNKKASTCLYDEGGPLFIRKTDYQIGLSNFHRNCKKERQPTKFQSLYYFKKAIERCAKNEECHRKTFIRLDVNTPAVISETFENPEFPKTTDADIPSYIHKLRECSSNVGNYGRGEHVVVLDSGCQGYGMDGDWNGCLNYEGKNTYDCYMKRETHGTEVASVIAHKHFGVAPQTRVTCINVSSLAAKTGHKCIKNWEADEEEKSCVGFLPDIVLEGLKIAKKQNPTVINLSLSWVNQVSSNDKISSDFHKLLTEIGAISMADNSIKIVLSSGDDQKNACDLIPGFILRSNIKHNPNNILIVQAVDEEFNPNEYTNYGDDDKCVVMGAKGFEISTTSGYDGRIEKRSSSSFSAALISGSIAILKSNNVSVTRENLSKLSRHSVVESEPCPFKEMPDVEGTGTTNGNSNIISQWFRETHQGSSS